MGALAIVFIAGCFAVRYNVDIFVNLERADATLLTLDPPRHTVNRAALFFFLVLKSV